MESLKSEDNEGNLNKIRVAISKLSFSTELFASLKLKLFSAFLSKIVILVEKKIEFFWRASPLKYNQQTATKANIRKNEKPVVLSFLVKCCVFFSSMLYVLYLIVHIFRQIDHLFHS